MRAIGRRAMDRGFNPVLSMLAIRAGGEGIGFRGEALRCRMLLRLESGMEVSRKPCGEALRTLETVKVAVNMCVYPCRRDGWSYRSGNFW